MLKKIFQKIIPNFSLPLKRGLKIFLGGTLVLGIFGLVLKPDFFAQQLSAQLTSQNSGQHPTIYSFYPQEGSTGTMLSISGWNFGTESNQNVVGFGEYPAEIQSVGYSDTNQQTILVKVPDLPAIEAGQDYQEYYLTVATSNGSAIADIPFRFKNATSEAAIPIISYFNPMSGEPGAEVYLYGENFASTPAENIIKFNGVEAQQVEGVFQDGQYVLKVFVPEGATTGHLTLTVNNLTADSVTDFTVLPSTQQPVFEEITAESVGLIQETDIVAEEVEEAVARLAPSELEAAETATESSNLIVPEDEPIHASAARSEIYLQGFLATNGEVQLNWQVPEEQAEISNFQVFYSTDPEEFVHGVMTDQTEISLGENLISEQTYYFVVKTAPSLGSAAGLQSNKVTVYFPGVAEAPTISEQETQHAAAPESLYTVSDQTLWEKEQTWDYSDNQELNFSQSIQSYAVETPNYFAQVPNYVAPEPVFAAAPTEVTSWYYPERTPETGPAEAIFYAGLSALILSGYYLLRRKLVFGN